MSREVSHGLLFFFKKNNRVLKMMAAKNMMRAVIADCNVPALVSRAIPALVDDGDVLVRVHYTALNRMDLLQVAGKYPVPPGASDILGVELSGVVAESNSKAFAKGDKVMALCSGGTYADYTLVNENTLMKIPRGLSMKEAAAIPETWLTAFQLLHLVGGPLCEGEKVLIHAAGSGVGCAAIQLACGAGAVPFATAGSDEKLKKAAELGARAGFNYKTGPWIDGVKEASMDLILDCIGKSYVEQNVSALALDGRWVNYGFMSGPGIGDEASKMFLAMLLRKRASLITTTLRSRSKEYKANLVKRFIDHAGPKFESGTYEPVLDEKSFSLEDVKQAHAYMASNKNIGKIVLKVFDKQ